jgi:hypothetical protein
VSGLHQNPLHSKFDRSGIGPPLRRPLSTTKNKKNIPEIIPKSAISSVYSNLVAYAKGVSRENDCGVP